LTPVCPKRQQERVRHQATRRGAKENDMARSALMTAAAALLIAAPAAAKDVEWLITPYLMLPSLNGKTGIGPVSKSVDASAIDLLSNLNWAIMGSGEVNNGTWGAKIDIMYSSLGKNVGLDERLDLDAGQGLYTFRLQRNISEGFWIYAGARLNTLSVDLNCNDNACIRTLPADRLNNGGVGTDVTWVDPIVGFQLNQNFSDKVRFLFEGDVGGFGAGSQIAVTAWPQIGIRVGKSGTALIGYRIIYVDYKDDITKFDRFQPDFVWDMNMFGPTIGYQFRF
jgi:hypothetical protein